MLALLVLVLAGQGQHFFYDEWAFVGDKLDATPLPDRYLLPHNEHWTMLPLLAYRILGATVGVGSYWPYLGVLLLAHLGVTHLLWRIMLVTGSKPLVATSLAAIFSVFGAAAEDLVWAFQITFVGSTLLGLAAVYLAVTGSVGWRKTVVLVFLITASLSSSGVGLAYLLVVPFVLAWRQRRHGLVALCVPLLVYLTWYATYGHPLTHAPAVSAALPFTLFGFVMFGLVAALTGYFGFPMNSMISWLMVGGPFLAGLTVSCRRWMADRTFAGRTLSVMFIGAVTFFGTVGLARAGFGPGFAASSRYAYVAVALCLPSIAVLISRGTDRHPRLTMVIVPAAVAMALSNMAQLVTYATATRDRNGISRRVLVAAEDLARGHQTIFADQAPEPLLAPDLTTEDLMFGHLDAALRNVRPTLSDDLTASLNLQIQVTPDLGRSAGPCVNTLKEHITIPMSQKVSPSFRLARKTSVVLTLQDGGSLTAQREMVLTENVYRVNSLRDPGHLTIDTMPSSAVLATC